MPNQGTVMDWRRSTRGCEFLRSTIGSGRKRYFFRRLGEWSGGW